MSFYVISRDFEKCELLCDICCDSIPPLRDGPVKVAGWAYRHNKKCLHDLQDACPAKALRIDRL